MERNYNFDVNVLPVHMFVKTPKEAKKIDKQRDVTHSEPVIYKREHKFRPVNYSYNS